MKNETNNKEDSVKQSTESLNSDTSKQSTSIKKAEDRDKIPSIESVLPDGEVFSYPLLEVFLGGGEKKQAVLEQTEIISGGYGESVTLKLDGENYRSNSKTIVRQVKQLLDMSMIPVRVNVGVITGKSGRKYFTLNAK
jgi:hypothetical protein